MGSHRQDDSSTSQTKNKITVICETDKIAQMASCYLSGTDLLKAARPPDSRPPATWPSLQGIFHWWDTRRTPSEKENLQFSSVTQSCLTACNPMNCSTPGLPVHHQLLEFTQTHVHRVGDAKQPSHPLSSPSPPAPNPSQHQSLFQWVNSYMRWPKYWSFSFSISPSNEHPGLISLRMD